MPRKIPAGLYTSRLLYLGGIFDGLNLHIYPQHLIQTPHIQLINLALTILCVGWVVMQISKAKQKYGKQRLRLDYFSYASLFALGIALARRLFI